MSFPRIKLIPLLKKVQITLDETSSDSEKSKVYMCFYDFVINNILDFDDFELFYKYAKSRNLDFANTILDKNKAKMGKNIIELLQTSIYIPLTKHKDYKKKINDVLRFEFEILKEVAKNARS
jgi:hypothetical protein